MVLVDYELGYATRCLSIVATPFLEYQVGMVVQPQTTYKRDVDVFGLGKNTLLVDN